MGIRSDNTKSSMSQAPAPGTYNPDHSRMMKSDGFTKFSQGTRKGMINEKQKASIPGPMEYNPDVRATKNSPAKFSFGGTKSAQRPATTETYMKNPGPGHYSVRSLLFEEGQRKPGGVIGSRYKMKMHEPGSNNVPGPGTYDGNF